MTRDLIKNRFNALPIEHRTTIIGYELEKEIRFFEREKNIIINNHKKNLQRINDRIKILTNEIKKLED